MSTNISCSCSPTLSNLEHFSDPSVGHCVPLSIANEMDLETRSATGEIGVGCRVRTRRDAQKQKARLSHLTEALLRGDGKALRRLERALELRLAQMQRQARTGATGPRGPQGARGPTGKIGRRGKIGKPGKKGPKGLKPTFPEHKVLAMIVTHFDAVYQQLNEQIRLIAKIQEQVNRLSRPSVASKQ